MAREALAPSSRWGVLTGVLFVTMFSACFALTEDDYNAKDGGPALGAGGKGSAGSATGSGGDNSAMAGTDVGASGTNVGNAGSVSNGGNAGSGGSGNAGNGGAAGNGGNGGNAGAGGAAGAAGAGGQAGNMMPQCPANPPNGTGTGLKGEYFSTMDFTGGVKVTRTDAKVDFDWMAGSPDAAIPVDKFSVKWTGQVQPKYTGMYTFSVFSDDGARLTVDGKLVIDKLIDQNTENTGMVALTAGTKYNLKLEYYEHGGGALARMSWMSACQAQEIVPTLQLYPTGYTGN